jgi:hypothetical protein
MDGLIFEIKIIITTVAAALSKILELFSDDLSIG